MASQDMSPAASGLPSIVAFCIRNWRMTIGIMLVAVIGGLLAVDSLPKDAEPDVPIPFINIQVVLPGVSPEDSERLLVRPMESELKSIEGLKEIQGIAAANVGIILLEFDIDIDADNVMADVIEKVDRARADFPQEAQQPIVEEISFSALPILTINLWGDAPERELQRYAKDLQRKLEALPLVLEAKISGERTDVLEAIIDPARTESLGITFEEIAAAVSRNNTLVPAGSLETNSGKFNIKLPGLIEQPSDMAELVIRSGSDGAITKLGDIAEVRRGYKDQVTLARFNGRQSVSLEISKRQGVNILEANDRIQALVDRETANANWPSTINVSYSQSRSENIKDMVAELSASIINAVVLVFIVCIAALGWRSAIFVGWAIPASFLIAFFGFFIAGETINMMILFGLILSVGVLVDSAIVIVEFADRKMEEGVSRLEAFKMAGERMFWPIMSSTATTLAAFIPLLFWESEVGKFMAYFPRTMIYVLSAATLMALIFLPTIGAKIGFRPKRTTNENMTRLSAGDGDPSMTTGMIGLYVRFIQRIINFPILVIAAMIALAFGIVALFGASLSGTPPKPVEFFTQSPSEQIYILARSRGNTTPEQYLKIATDLETRIEDIDGIASVYTVAGEGAGGGNIILNGPGNVPSDTVVRIYTELVPFAQRRNSQDILDELTAAVQGIPGIITEVVAVDQGPPVGKDIGVQISSDVPAELRAATAKVRAKFAEIDGLIDIEDTTPLPGVEWEFVVDRAEAGRLGLDVGRIGSALQFVTEGALVGRYRPIDANEEVDIRIRYPASARTSAELDRLRIQTPQGALPLSAVTTRIAKPRNDKIERLDFLPYYNVQANAAKGYATNILAEEISTWLTQEASFPPSVQIKVLGQQEENSEAIGFFKIAGVAIIFMMSVILLLQFNSFYHVFLTILAVVMSVFGVLLGLVFYPYISMILTLTGVIALAGIVVNNNIVLIDAYQRLREHGFEPVDAAVRTAAQRLRPVFLTTLTTVVGLMPLILGWQASITTGEFSTRGSSTSEIWAPISYVIACGLGFATILTLIVTPVMLAMPTVIRQRLQRFRRFQPKQKEAGFKDLNPEAAE